MAESVPNDSSAYLGDLRSSGADAQNSPEMDAVTVDQSSPIDTMSVLDYEDGIIPVSNARTLPSIGDEDRYARANFERLLEEIAIQKPSPQSRSGLRVAYTEPDITLRETQDELSVNQPQGNPSLPGGDDGHSSESFLGERFHSTLGEVPTPMHRTQRKGGGTGTQNSRPNSDVFCSFGFAKRDIDSQENRLSFNSEVFGFAEEDQFQNIFNTHANSTTGMLFLIITNWQAWFLPQLHKTIPNFPADTVIHLSQTRATTMLPLVDVETREISCIMEHIDISGDDADPNTEVLVVGADQARCLSIVVWTSAKELSYGVTGSQPLVVVISTSDSKLSSKISNHYMQTSNERGRWNRLQSNQIWIYLDLYFLFTRWDRVWGAIKQNLNARIEEVQGQRKAVSILERTRQLHMDNNVMISLREHLRIHKASLQVVIRRATGWLPAEQSNPTILHTRLDDASRLLDFYDVTATTLLEQQHNLLSLAFDLETVIQSQAVARLNALAFIFLPLSLVATIFGITTFTAPPKWYPVAAAPVMILTVVIAWVANKVLGSAPESTSRRPRNLIDVEERTASVAKMAKGGGTENYWGRIWGQKNFVKVPPPTELRFDAPTSISDPSRVSKPSQTSPTIPAGLQYPGFNGPEIPFDSEIQRIPRFVT